MKRYSTFENSLRQKLTTQEIIPFIGVYDVFSASLAAQFYDGIFISGFSFAASYYGLPDIGFIAWSDMVAFVQRVRTVLPHHHILVDIDDGYTDTETACHVVSLLEAIGTSAIVIEDQKRPRRCGHFDGKQLMELEEFLPKLHRVLATRREMLVIARTDASEFDDIIRRVRGFAQAGADAILVDAIADIALIKTLKNEVNLPIAFNQIAGGKSPVGHLQELKDAGVSLVIYSTPCLFAAQVAIEAAMKSLNKNDGLLPTGKGQVDVQSCTAILKDNMARRNQK